VVTERKAVSADELLGILVSLVAEEAHGHGRDQTQLRIAIWRAKGQPNWKARIVDAPHTMLRIFRDAVDRASKRYDLADDPIYHEATRRLVA
jgi:hypothetical protein